MVPAGHPLGGHSLPGVYAVQMAPSTSVLQHSYLQLAQQVRRDITLKRYAPGERLPSVRALAAAQGVSVATVVRCYRHLEALGVVQARHKSGMYVAEPAPVRAAPGAKDGADPSGGPGLQARARPAVPPPVEFDRLVSLEHRMTQLYALTTQQPLQWGLHLANAAPAWYPTEALARIAQRLLFSESWVAVYPQDHPLPPTVTLQGLNAAAGHLPLIRYSQRSVIGQQIERFLRHVGVNAPRGYEFDATDPLLSLVASGLGWALSTPLCLWQSRQYLDDVVVIPIPATRLGQRHFFLLSREDEWAGLDEHIARITRDVIRHDTAPAIRLCMPALPPDALSCPDEETP